MTDLDTEVHTVKIRLCVDCLDGKGGQCHVPGCALWLNRAPDIAISVLLYENLDRHDWAEVQARAIASIKENETP